MCSNRSTGGSIAIYIGEEIVESFVSNVYEVFLQSFPSEIAKGSIFAHIYQIVVRCSLVPMKGLLCVDRTSRFVCTICYCYWAIKAIV